MHQPPPLAERLNRRKILLVVSGIGLVLAGFFLLRVLRHATAQRTIPPAPLPPVYDVTGAPMPVHKVLDAPASYQDVPRPPRIPPAPVVVQEAPLSIRVGAACPGAGHATPTGCGGIGPGTAIPPTATSSGPRSGGHPPPDARRATSPGAHARPEALAVERGAAGRAPVSHVHT